MTNSTSLAGQCLCGAVRFTAKAEEMSVTACHCDMCRRWSAGPFMGLRCQEVAFKGEEDITRLRTSEWAERGHCTKCGSNLFCRIVGATDHQMAVGLFDDQTGFRLSLQYYIDRKPEFYYFANETETMTEAEVIAKYAPDLK